MTDARPGPARPVCSYYVDEAGDGTLFNRKGQVMVGKPGCSRFFVLGLAEIAHPDSLAKELSDLRVRLLGDPYFRGVPSLQPDARKTALAFHAKDDLPEVRREVFSLLLKHDIRFFAVVRDKRSVLGYVRQRNEREPTYRYHPDELYDSLVRRLFRDRLHEADAYVIWFAKRGRSDRTGALRAALELARKESPEGRGMAVNAMLDVLPSVPPKCPGLQAADYLLWSVQRLYERREERFARYAWPLFRLVHDMDDTRVTRYGADYTKDRPLTLAAIKELPEI